MCWHVSFLRVAANFTRYRLCSIVRCVCFWQRWAACCSVPCYDPPSGRGWVTLIMLRSASFPCFDGEELWIDDSRPDVRLCCCGRLVMFRSVARERIGDSLQTVTQTARQEPAVLEQGRRQSEANICGQGRGAPWYTFYLQCSSLSSILEGHACSTQVHFHVCSQARVCVSCVG